MKPRIHRIFALVCFCLIGLSPLLVPIALAQSPTPAPRRLTFDGRAAPRRWTVEGIWYVRQGDVIQSNGQARIAQELWRIAPTATSAERISLEAPDLSPRTDVSASRVRILNGNTPDPELWLFDVAGRPLRLLLKGNGEIFGTPTFASDGERFVFTRLPLGSETADHSAIWLGNLSGATPTLLVAQAAFPVWSPDGAEIAFAHRGDVYVASAQTPITLWLSTTQPVSQSLVETQALSAPATIRVLHTQGNHDYANCRPTTLTIGSIMTLPFELYVSYVVPTEVGALSSHPERLKAQAVAARTYAWRRINSANPYDVTDWTDSQAMCEFREHPNSTAAVSATLGQYIAYNGNVIAALYSAENGDPTLSNGNLASFPYLRAINDPVSFGRTRNGHGQGMSQNGAQRWAVQYGWNYIQILSHYYTGVTIEGQTNFGALHQPWHNFYLNSNRARIGASASNSNTLNIFAQGVGISSTQIASQALATVLDLSALPDQPLGALLITASLTRTLNLTPSLPLTPTTISTLTLGIDRALPTGTLQLPTTTTNVSLTAVLSGSDVGPSGFAGYGLSNNWIWEGEAQNVFGAGAVVSDAAALNGVALRALTNTSGVWFGPYTYDLPPAQAYRAYFRLKTSNVTTTQELAKLDIVADAQSPIGLRYIYGTDFRAPLQYQEFAVDFDYVNSTTNGIEFRVDFAGQADLWLDRILIATYPLSTPLTTTWTLRPFTGTQTVIAKFNDYAGNVSADVTRTIVLTNPVNLILTPTVFVPLVIR